MKIYNKIKKEHVFIFLILLTTLILFNYFDFGYSGLVTKRTCYSEGYSCCNIDKGEGINHFSLDESCSYEKRCYESCKYEESRNLVTSNVGFIDTVVNFFKNLFVKKEVVGSQTTCNCCRCLYGGEGGDYLAFNVNPNLVYSTSTCNSYCVSNDYEPGDFHQNQQAQTSTYSDICTLTGLPIEGNCEIGGGGGGDCTSGNLLLSYEDGHASLTNNYENLICSTTFTTSGGNVPVVNLSGTTNAHVSKTSATNNFQTSLKIKAVNNGNVVCSYSDENPNCDGTPAKGCLFSIYNAEGGHIYGCGLSNINVCCTVGGQQTTCGNGIINPPELCDPGNPPSIPINLNGKDCTDISHTPPYTGGTLSCYTSGINACTFNTQGCTVASGTTSLLTVTKAGTGTGTVTSTDPVGGISCGQICSSNYLKGINVTLVAVPNSLSSNFSGWIGCNYTNNFGTWSMCKVNMSYSRTVTAIFTLKSQNNPQTNICDCELDSDCNQGEYCDLDYGCNSNVISQGSPTTNAVLYTGLCRPLNSSLVLENCNSPNNNVDGDNAIAALDTDCESQFNNFVKLDLLTINGLLSNNKAYSDSTLDINCNYRVVDNNGDVQTTYNTAGYNCIKARIGSNECSKTSLTGTIARFMNCNVGSSLGDKLVVCYIDENCERIGNDKQQFVNVTEYNYCSNYDSVNDNFLYINDLGIGGTYDPGDVLEINPLVYYYYLNDNKNLRTSAAIVDIRNDNKFNEQISNEISTIYGEDYGFNLNITVPGPSSNGIYKLFVKAYTDNICSQKDYLIGITTPDCIDEDNDNYCSYEDCNDNNANINPGAVEICSNAVDDDCDSLIDNNDPDCISNQTCFEGNTQQCNTGLQGVCSTGIKTCINGIYSSCVQTMISTIEQCTDSLDNDCDGLSDCSDSDCSALAVCKQGGHEEEPGAGEDKDNDGMDDAWESKYFNNLSQGPDADYDGDGVSNLQEFKDGTDPTDENDYLKKGNKLVLLIIGIVILIGAIVFVVLKFFNKPKKRDFSRSFYQMPSSSIDPKLRQYVKDSLRRGFSKDQIRRALKAKGWKDSDIENAFR